MAGLLRTIVVDSDPESRSTLRRILGGTPSVVLVGEFAEAREAVLETPARRPDLLLLELPVRHGHDDAQAAADLVQRFTSALPDVAVVAMGASVSADLVLRVIRAGALEFLARPVEREDLVAVLEKLGRVRRGTAAQKRLGRMTSVFSTKGGLGVTTVAINLAVCIAEEHPEDTLLIELDSRQSDITTFLDLRPTYSVLDAFENIERLDESFLRGLLVRHSSGLWVLPAPVRMERSQLDGDHVRAGLEIIRSHFGHVILDLRHDTTPSTFAGLEASDTILFLTGLNVSALRSGAAGITGLRHLGLDLNRLKVIVMREDTGEDVTLKHARETLGLGVYWKTPSDYQTVIASINAGRPVVTSVPRSKIARSLRQLAGMVSGAAGAQGPAVGRRAGSLLRMVWSPKGASGA